MLKNFVRLTVENGPIIILAVGFIDLFIGVLEQAIPAAIFGSTMVIVSWLWTICRMIERIKDGD